MIVIEHAMRNEEQIPANSNKSLLMTILYNFNDNFVTIDNDPNNMH